MDKTFKQALHKRRYTNGQSAYFKMPTLLAFGHMKIKTMVTYQYTPTRIVKIKDDNVASRTVKWYNQFRKLAVPYKVKYASTP